MLPGRRASRPADVLVKQPFARTAAVARQITIQENSIDGLEGRRSGGNQPGFHPKSKFAQQCMIVFNTGPYIQAAFPR
jgi:hypothetical protein